MGSRAVNIASCLKDVVQSAWLLCSITFLCDWCVHASRDWANVCMDRDRRCQHRTRDWWSHCASIGTHLKCLWWRRTSDRLFFLCLPTLFHAIRGVNALQDSGISNHLLVSATKEIRQSASGPSNLVRSPYDWTAKAHDGLHARASNNPDGDRTRFHTVQDHCGSYDREKTEQHGAMLSEIELLG